MTVFDPTLEAEPVQEQNNEPILPEERFIFELIGFERSAPDQWHKIGGVKWTFAVYDMDGHPFEFNDEPYELWRTTNINKQGKPLFTIGTQAHEWASALLGRTLGVDDNFSISELRGKRFSSQIVWQPKKTKPKEKSAVLASLRHIAVGAPVTTNGQTARPAPGQVLPDPTSDEIDRALIVTEIKKKVTRLTKLNAESGKDAAAAVAASDLATAPLAELQRLQDEIQAALNKALDD